jgi:hypothetical protein
MEILVVRLSVSALLWVVALTKLLAGKLDCHVALVAHELDRSAVGAVTVSQRSPFA